MLQRGRTLLACTASNRSLKTISFPQVVVQPPSKFLHVLPSVKDFPCLKNNYAFKGLSTTKWEGGFLGGLAESAAGGLTQAIEDASNRVTEVVENTSKSVASTIEATANSVTGVVGNVTDSAKNTAESVKGELDGAKSAANEGIDSLKGTGKQITSGLRDTADSVSKDVHSATQQVADNISGKAAAAKEASTVLVADIHKTTSSLHGTADALASDLKFVAENTRSSVEKQVSESKQRAESTLSDAKGSLDGVRNDLSELVAHKSALAKDSVKEAHDSAYKFAKSTTDDAKKSANAAFQDLNENATSAVDDLKKTGSAIDSVKQDLTQNVATSTTTLRGAIKGTSAAATKAVKDIGGSVTKATGELSQSLTSAVQTVAGNLVSGAEGAVGNLVGKAALGGEGLLKGVTQLLNTSAPNQEDDDDEMRVETVEGVVCKETDLKDGEMKEFPLGEEGRVLLIKDEGKFSALGTKCTHYGAPMANGILYKGRVRCPWHGACFNATTGDIEESPGADSLPCYKVTIENGDVKVSAPKDLLKKDIRIKSMVSRENVDSRTFVIIGGGTAGQTCAETLRAEGFGGRIVILTAEDCRPYDRPRLSKAMHLSASEVALRNEVFYQNTDIELWLNHEVSSVDTKKKVVKCTNGATLPYDNLLIATGGITRKFDVPGSDLKNISYLRTPEESNSICEMGKDKNVIINGAAFIGIEVAGYLVEKASSVTVISRGSVPFSTVFGKEIGGLYKKYFESKGIVFEAETEIVEFQGKNGKVASVVCKNGKTLPADVVVIGIGVYPATDFLKDSGIPLNSKGFVPVNEYLKTPVDNVFAAGDITEFPLTLFDNVRTNIAHWQMAQTQGRNAARNMLGKEIVLATVPFFWMIVLEKGIRYAGFGEDADEIIIQGDREKLFLAAYFCKGNDVMAVASMGILTAVNYAHYVQNGKKLTKQDIMTYPDNGWFKALA